MVKWCCAFGCSNKEGRDNVSFYRFPKQSTSKKSELEVVKNRRRLWINAVKRAARGSQFKVWQPSNHDRLCSAHFLSGKKSDDPISPDFVPSVFSFTLPSQLRKAENSLKSFNRWQQSTKLKEDRKARHEAAMGLVDLSAQMVPVGTDEKENGVYEENGIPSESDSDTVSIASGMLDYEAKVNDALQQECQELREQNVPFNNKICKLSLHEHSFEDDKKVKFYTGLENFAQLKGIADLIAPLLKPAKLTAFQQILLCLMKLRLNLLFQDLGYRFGVHQSTASRIFLNVIDALNISLVPTLVFWPDRDEVQKTLPMSFRVTFPSCIAIIDCFEIFIERPKDLKARAQTWSNYKHHNTAKYLIAVAPQGSVTFVSKGWGGRTSDKCLTENCSLFSYLIPGDVILADRGFDVKDSVALYQCKLEMPAFTRGKKQLSMIETQETRELASQRIHVERVIGLLRNKYSILKDTQPLTMLQKDDSGLTCLDKCVRVACALVNMCPSVVPFE